MIAAFFIRRPVMANVIAVLTLVIGAVAVLRLPIAQYPPLTPPTIQVSTSYPGASAATVQEVVARTIESQVNGVPGMLYMQSTSSNDGRYVLIVSFAVGTDPDQAQVAVQNRVSAALPLLPGPVQQQGVVTKKKSTAILQIVTLTSTDPRHDGLFLSNFASLRLRDRLARLPGVADVSVFGAGAYSMRIWLDADRMRQRGLDPSTVLSVVAKQTQRIGAGQVGMPPVPPGRREQLTLLVDAPSADPAAFGALIVASAADGSVTRLRDVARVELGSQNYSQAFSFDGRPAGGIAIYQLPEANAIDTARAVRNEVARLAADFPAGVQYAIPLDTTVFVNASIDEVYRTLAAAGVLVLLVILVFLQDWRATLVPATTVPVTVVGAFAAMAALGFSINLLTLFAIVLCIGIVVDDAIVVVEGVEQHLGTGLRGPDAAVRAMQELLGPIVGITLVLVAVFLPAAFIPGITGQMYRQFALVIAATAAISGINAVTLKPTQSAQYLRPHDPGRPRGAFSRAFDRVWHALSAAYLRLIARLLARRRTVAVAALAVMALSGWAFLRLPTAFIPTEDQGYLMVAVQLPDAASLARTQAALDRLVRAGRALPGVDHAIAIAGVSPLDSNASLANAGLVYFVLKDWSQRAGQPGQDLLSLYERMGAALASVPDAGGLVLVPPPINGLGLAGGFQMQLVLTDGSDDWGKLDLAARRLVEAASADARFQRVFTPLRATVPQLTLSLDRTRAETLGVSVGDAYDALQTYLGSSYASQFPKFGQNYTVYVQADASSRDSEDAIGRIAVRSRTGQMVPISAFGHFGRTRGPAVAASYNLQPTAAIVGAAARGYSSGQALQALEEIAARTLPPGVGYEWTAISYQERLVGRSVLLAFALALLLVYLVLAAQYESWFLPLAVLLAVPLSFSGAALTLWLAGAAVNIYVQIGLVLLIALSAKNAILIVEVAHERVRAGASAVEAALEAARRRFRPIVMTSFAFILGVLPLVLASGAGASARKSIGITVFTGMLASTVLAVAVVPVFFVLIEALHARQSRGQPPSIQPSHP